MLQIPRRVEYALSAALALTQAGEDAWIPFKEIAAEHDIPQDYLAKILRSLVDAGLVDSKRGANGGYRLAKKPEDITFLEVIEAADSPVAVNHCTEHGVGCTKQDDCAMADVWQRAEDAMRGVFATTTLACMSATGPLTFGRLESKAGSPGCPYSGV